MDEMVAANGESVAVARDLPDGEIGIHHLGTRADGSGTSVNGLHGICAHIIGQSA